MCTKHCLIQHSLYFSLKQPSHQRKVRTLRSMTRPNPENQIWKSVRDMVIKTNRCSIFLIYFPAWFYHQDIVKIMTQDLQLWELSSATCLEGPEPQSVCYDLSMPCTCFSRVYHGSHISNMSRKVLPWQQAVLHWNCRHPHLFWAYLKLLAWITVHQDYTKCWEVHTIKGSRQDYKVPTKATKVSISIWTLFWMQKHLPVVIALVWGGFYS